MKAYETIVVIRPDVEEEGRKAILDRVTSTIEAAGIVQEVDEWGTRKLAYEIAKKYTEGYYVLITFDAEKSVLDALNHYYRITDTIIRDIIVCLED